MGALVLTAAASFDSDGHILLTTTVPGSLGLTPTTVTAATNDNLIGAGLGSGCQGAVNYASNGSTFTRTGGSGSTPTDSQNLQSLQTGITKSVANVSGQVVTTQVGGGIDGAFSDGGNPVTFTPGGATINFAATPKSEIEKRTDDAFAALGYAGMPIKAPRKLAPYKEWGAWLDLRGTGWQNHQPTVGMDGSQYNITAGVSRKLTPDFLVGLYGGYEYFRYTIAAIAGYVRGTGGSIGPYVGWRITPNLRFEALVGYTRLAYSATAGTASGSYGADRFLASSTLTGYVGLGVYKIEPSASIYALWEKQGAWTDSLGTAQAERKFSAGRASIGGKTIREFASGETKIAPYVGFYGDWRFSSDNAVAGGTPIVGIGDGWSGRVTSGATFTWKNGGAVAVGGDYGGLGAVYKVWTGNVRASLPF